MAAYGSCRPPVSHELLVLVCTLAVLFLQKGFDDVVLKGGDAVEVGKSRACRWGDMIMFTGKIPTESGRKA